MNKLHIRISIIISLFFLSNGLSAQTKLSLSEAIRIGVENNYGVKISRNLTQQANQRNTYGMAGGLPSITLGASSFANEDIISSASNINAQLSADLNWTLFDGFLVQANKSQLENSVLLSEGMEMIELENTIQSIINLYYYIILQQELLEVNLAVLEISKDRLEQQETAKDIGASGKYEYILAQTDYLSDKTNYLNQELLVRNSIRNLNTLLAFPVDAQWTLDDQIIIPNEVYDIEAMKIAMLENNTNLKNQYLNLKAKEIEVKKMRSEYYPSIGLNLSFDAGLNMVGSNTSHYARPQVGLNLSYTLFNGGKNNRNTNIAKLSKEAEDLATEEMKLLLDSELYSQYETYMLYTELVKLENEKLAAAQILLDLSREKYKAGVINSFNFREVQLSYLSSAVSQLNSILELIFTNTELTRLTGGILNSNN